MVLFHKSSFLPCEEWVLSKSSIEDLMRDCKKRRLEAVKSYHADMITDNRIDSNELANYKKLFKKSRKHNHITIVEWLQEIIP